MWSINKSKLNISYNPQVVNIDFEAAAVAAIKEMFPNTQVDGCNFHWKKCIFDNVDAEEYLSSMKMEIFQVLAIKFSTIAINWQHILNT